MKKFLWLICVLTGGAAWGQNSQLLSRAMEGFNSDDQLKYAISSLYVIDAAQGNVVFDQNSNMGLAPASTQKIITAAAALERLGAGYTYETRFGIMSTPTGKSLLIQPSGDPTLASERWDDTRDAVVLEKLGKTLADAGIKNLESIIINTAGWDDETIPDAWIWQDLGNYYGAGAQPLNWRENKFDLVLKSDAQGSGVSIIKTNPVLYDYKIVSQATAGPKGSGDNSYLYYPSMGMKTGVLRGTIGAGENNFVVSGSFYDPMNQVAKTIIQHLKGKVGFKTEKPGFIEKANPSAQWLFTQSSPSLSKIVYWFLRKSVNLYGEALLKTMALKGSGLASTQEGVTALLDFWKTKGIDAEALHLYDGSGLSPQNRVTTRAEVQVLKYAKDQPWFRDYYEAFPLYNNIKMKSGTINRVKGFAGYITSKEGKEYIFSFLVNNYNGSETALIRKMYKVLDQLK